DSGTIAGGASAPEAGRGGGGTSTGGRGAGATCRGDAPAGAPGRGGRARGPARGGAGAGPPDRPPTTPGRRAPGRGPGRIGPSDGIASWSVTAMSLRLSYDGDSPIGAGLLWPAPMAPTRRPLRSRGLSGFYGLIRPPWGCGLS